VAFRQFGVLGLGNPRGKCSGIESLGLPVPEVPKSHGSSDQREAYSC
jgi:hypothetical protein